jgi:hypothetical protein
MAAISAERYLGANGLLQDLVRTKGRGAPQQQQLHEAGRCRWTAG